MNVTKHMIKIARWCCLLLLPFVAMAISYLIDDVLVLAVKPAWGIISDVIFGASWVFITIFPAAAIAPHKKTAAALLFAVGINGFHILSKPISPHWTYWVLVMSSFFASAIAVALIYWRYGLSDYDRGWPAPLTIVLRNRLIRSITMSVIIGVGVALLSMGVYREWGVDPNEQFRRGFPFRITYGSKWSVGFSTDHLGFILNCLLYGSIFRITLLAWRRLYRKRS